MILKHYDLSLQALGARAVHWVLDAVKKSNSKTQDQMREVQVYLTQLHVPSLYNRIHEGHSTVVLYFTQT